MTISLDVLSTREGVLMYPNQAAEEIENGGTFIAEITYETLSTRAGVLRFPQEAANRILQIAASSSTSVTLLTDLIAYYRFNGNGNDSSGNSRHLTVNSGTLVAGKVNGALNGGGAVIDGLTIPTTGELTISMWVNLGANVGDIGATAQVQVTSAFGDAYVGLVQNSRDGSDTGLVVNATAQSIGLSLSGTITSDTQWIHVVAVLGSSGLMIFYVNGVNEGDNSYALFPFTIDSIAVVSNIDYPSNVGDVGIWNRALSEAEILQLYNSGNGLDPTA